MRKALLHHLGNSVSFGRLSLGAKVLWTMLLTSADNQGRGPADPDVVKWQVCPNVPELTPANIPAALDEMVRQEMLHLYTDGRRQLYQIVRWWDYQHLQWAQPSHYQPPAGWTDRVRTQRGRRHVSQNWDTHGGFLDGPPPRPEAQAPPSPAGPAAGPPDDPPGDSPGDPPGNPAGDPPGHPPADPPGQPPEEPPGQPPGAANKLKSTQIKPNQTKSNQAKPASPVGDARAGPVTEPGTPKTRPRRGQNRSPPAVLAFRRAAHRYPPKSWYGDVDGVVGREEADLQFWEQVVKEWVGHGWNPTNVSGMLECYGRRQLPGRGPRAAGPPADPIQAAIQAIEEEGWT